MKFTIDYRVRLCIANHFEDEIIEIVKKEESDAVERLQKIFSELYIKIFEEARMYVEWGVKVPNWGGSGTRFYNAVRKAYYKRILEIMKEKI